MWKQLGDRGHRKMARMVGAARSDIVNQIISLYNLSEKKSISVFHNISNLQMHGL